VDGCATWTPGDKMVFDALNGFTDVVSTKEFNNQMATTLIILKQWADANKQVVTNILTASFTASNQMKQYDSMEEEGIRNYFQTFGMENPQYWVRYVQRSKRGKKWCFL
jgi:predicted secreted Zn-dependent protease